MCSLPSPPFREFQLRVVLTRRMSIDHPVHGLDHLLGLGGHVANVLAHEFDADDKDNVAAAGVLSW